MLSVHATSTSPTDTFNDEALFEKYSAQIISAFMGTKGQFSFHADCVMDCARMMIASLGALPIYCVDQDDILDHEENYDPETHPDTVVAQIALNPSIIISPLSLYPFRIRIYLAMDGDLFDKQIYFKISDIECDDLRKYIFTRKNDSSLNSIRTKIAASLLGYSSLYFTYPRDKFRCLTQITVGALITAMTLDDSTLGLQKRFNDELLYPYFNIDDIKAYGNHYSRILQTGQLALNKKLPFGCNLLKPAIFPKGPSYHSFCELSHLQNLFDHFNLVTPKLTPFTEQEKTAYLKKKEIERHKSISFYFKSPNSSITSSQGANGTRSTLATSSSQVKATSQSLFNSFATFWNSNKGPAKYFISGIAAAGVLITTYKLTCENN